MKEMIINGKNVAQGKVVTAIEALLNGDDSLMYHWDEQFYYIYSEVLPGYAYMVRKEFNCLTVWLSALGPTSFCGGDERVQELYKPLCILSKPREFEYNPDWNDVCRDLVNGLIRIRLLQADTYLSPEDGE